MKADDKKIREAFKELKVPVSYEEKIEEVLSSINSDSQPETPGRRHRAKYVFRTAVCLLCVFTALTVAVLHSDAGFLQDFRNTLLSFFGFGTAQEAGDAGMGSKSVYVEGQPDLIVELRETVIDTHTIYLLVKVTAPPNIAFTEDVGFDYFCFCTGKNYDVDHLIAGSQDVRLLEIGEERPNEALYVISKCFEEEIPVDSPVTCFLKDLTLSPYSDHPELLVSGLWSLPFHYEPTITESVSADGSPELAFPFLDGEAVIEQIELTPTGMSIWTDISSTSCDLLWVSNTALTVRLLYLDGSETLIFDPASVDSCLTRSSFFSCDEDGARLTLHYVYEFEQILEDIKGVSGFYVQDVYVPVR